MLGSLDRWLPVATTLDASTLSLSLSGWFGGVAIERRRGTQDEGTREREGGGGGGAGSPLSALGAIDPRSIPPRNITALPPLVCECVCVYSAGSCCNPLRNAAYNVYALLLLLFEEIKIPFL